jgi:N-acetyl-gamma-glutamyl-phosphate reductase
MHLRLSLLLAIQSSLALKVPRGIGRAALGVRAKVKAKEKVNAKAIKCPKESVNVAILGASGYTGAELVRLLYPHPHATISILTANSQAGQSMSSVFPQFSMLPDLPLLKSQSDITDKDWADCDVVFACLPHTATQDIILKLPKHLKIIDLSADFRLEDPAVYEEWYGGVHSAVELQGEAVYGLTELYRDKIRGARLVANPGCYPTAAQLALVPLVEAGLVESSGVIIDAKSGATGAGRAAKVGTLFCEVADGVHAYGVASHRHAPEIEQGLRWAAAGVQAGGGGKPVAAGSTKVATPTISFTPHLMPMSRGILETIYVQLKPGKKVALVRAALEAKFASEHFVTVLPEGRLPTTRHVKGSNHCFLQVRNNKQPCGITSTLKTTGHAVFCELDYSLCSDLLLVLCLCRSLRTACQGGPLS